MRRRRVAVGLAVACAAVLCACSNGGGATPRVSSTPPSVQGTVPVGATLSGSAAAVPAQGHVMSDGRSMSGGSMSGMSMPASRGAGTPATVPHGTGSHDVAAPDVDGCNRSYGVATQCVPLRAPGGGPVTCAVLRAYHYLPLLVTEDPLHLVSGAAVRVTGGRTYLTGCTA